MEIAVFSDIHGNHSALQACFDYCVGKGITNYILLGDYVTDCPNPEKTMELLYMMKQYFHCTFIRGNREDYLLDYRKRGELGWHIGSASGSLLYTYQHLEQKDLDFFETLPIYGIWQEKGYGKLEICHGSPESSKELMFKGKRNTRKILSHLKTNMLLHGHNHVQDFYEYRGRWSVNPGSIGIPWYHEGKTQITILHSEGTSWVPENVQLEYNREEILSEFKESGLCDMAPAWAAVTMHTIRTGVDLNETVLLRAMSLCREDKGNAVWPDIPERYWAQALRENHIDLAGKDIPVSGKENA